MNEEIPCITNKGKTVKNEWEKDDSDFLLALYSVSKKLGHFFFHNLLTNSFKRSSVTSYKYLSKLTLNVPVLDKVKKLSEIFISIHLSEMNRSLRVNKSKIKTFVLGF